jgi:protein SCO1
LKTFNLISSLCAGFKRGVLLIGVLGVLSCSQSSVSFNSVDITGADYARDLTWQDRTGAVHQLQAYKGQVVLVFFGYTQCPDVCPSSLSELKAIKADLGEQGQKVKALFVSVDPERDTQEVLDAYMANFGEDFSGVSLGAEQLKQAAKDFKVFYQKTPGPTPTSYGVEHTAGFYVYDTHSKLRLFVRYGTPQSSLLQDLKTLLAQT